MPARKFKLGDEVNINPENSRVNKNSIGTIIKIGLPDKTEFVVSKDYIYLVKGKDSRGDFEIRVLETELILLKGLTLKDRIGLLYK